ncbi:unnamed protein product, partial [Mesorhabditis belari]|uniref:Secreted protein n=1 Tax=Mesorhabditis belari TaxID=2138241 RepID=A0AAF3EEM5_9BILA
MLFQAISLTLSLFILFSQSATIDRTISVKDNDPILLKLVYSVGIHRINEVIGDSMWWIPAGPNYSATRTITPISGDRHFTWVFKVLTQKSMCSRSSVPESNVKNCKLDVSAGKRICSVYISYNEKNEKNTMDSEVYC